MGFEFKEPDFSEAPWKNEEELKAARLINLPLAVQYDAYKWLNAYIDQLNDMVEEDEYSYDRSEITFSEVMNTAISHQGGWGDYIVRGGTFESFSVEPLFWEKFAEYYGIPRSAVNESSFFSCSC